MFRFFELTIESLAGTRRFWQCPACAGWPCMHEVESCWQKVRTDMFMVRVSWSSSAAGCVHGSRIVRLIACQMLRVLCGSSENTLLSLGAPVLSDDPRAAGCGSTNHDSHGITQGPFAHTDDAFSLSRTRQCQTRPSNPRSMYSLS